MIDDIIGFYYRPNPLSILLTVNTMKLMYVYMDILKLQTIESHSRP